MSVHRNWVTGVKRIQGGKTVKVDIRVYNGVIEDIVISGDFFAYPEEAIDQLEEELKGKKIEDVDKVLNKYRDHIELVGLTFHDLASLIRELIRR